MTPCPCGATPIAKLNGSSLEPVYWCPDCNRLLTLDCEPHPDTEPCSWCREPSGYDNDECCPALCASCAEMLADEDEERPPSPREARLHRAIERSVEAFKTGGRMW